MSPKAFVLMPFDSDFNEIYNLFIASILSEAGYEVFRADDIVSQRNILEDIIASIHDSDLLVADLTGSNPNVYYELGIAHTFGKPVILLTQSVSDLPFDLQSYRVLQYNTHFVAIDDAKNKLRELAEAARKGELIFRSPLTDFGYFENTALRLAEVKVSKADNLGFMDHVIRMKDGFKVMSEVITQIGKRMREVNITTETVTGEIKSLVDSKDPDSLRRFRLLLNNFAVTQHEYADFLKKSNDKMETNLDQTFSSVEFVILFKTPSTNEERAALTGLLTSLADLEKNSQAAVNSFSRLGTSVKATPRLERTLNIAMDEVGVQLDRFIGYTQQVIAVSSKLQAIAKKLLGD